MNKEKGKKRIKQLFVILLIVGILVVFSSSFFLLWADAATLTVGLGVENHTEQEIRDFYNTHYTGKVTLGFDGAQTSTYHIDYEELPNSYMAPYASGKISEDECEYAINSLNLIRYIAGLSQVEVSDEYTKKAQASALVTYVNNYLTHYPIMPSGMDPFVGRLGVEAAKESNLAWVNKDGYSLKWAIESAWLSDSDEQNISTLGHRRWMLNPKMGKTGFGAVDGKNGTFLSMYAMDSSNMSANSTRVAWPAQKTPVELFNEDTAWSLSLGSEIKNPGTVMVILNKILDNGVSTYGDSSYVWTFTKYESDGELYVNNEKYGQQGCIIFKPEGIGTISPKDQFFVEVIVDNIVICYYVDFFSLTNSDYPAPKISSLTLDSSTGKPLIKWNKVSKAKSYTVYRRSLNGDIKAVKENTTSLSFKDTSAGYGIKYEYTVVANYANDIESIRSTDKSITVKLKTPTLSATAKAKKKNYLSWSSVSKATGYEVYRRVKGTTSWELMKTTATARTYTNTKVTSGKTYQYRVRAYREFNGNIVYGPYSSIKTVKTK